MLKLTDAFLFRASCFKLKFFLWAQIYIQTYGVKILYFTKRNIYVRIFVICIFLVDNDSGISELLNISYFVSQRVKISLQ